MICGVGSDVLWFLVGDRENPKKGIAPWRQCPSSSHLLDNGFVALWLQLCGSVCLYVSLPDFHPIPHF